jgi:hypothetical protein
MRVLFSFLHPGYLRNYQETIRQLAERGHRVHLLFDGHKPEYDGMAEALAASHPGISFTATSPPRRRDRWAPFVRLLRQLRDALRYEVPVYRRAGPLRQRAQKRLPAPLRLAVRGTGLLGRGPAVRLLQRAVHVAELAVPTDPDIRRFLAALAPDVVLLTPLVHLHSSQQDYVRAAQECGFPVALCVASWDNLTNKGLIGCWPDRVLLWNEAQRDEAVALHGIPPARVRITGAQCYDRWFEQRPATTRADFCSRVGLATGHPIVLYTCSSPFIGGEREAPFVLDLVRRMRQSDDAVLRQAGVLVRPHPQHARIWSGVDVSALGNVAIYPRSGANPVDAGRAADFFDSIFHSAVVVGLNTSAMIEAGIVGRPVLTLTKPELSGGQERTLHFHHLVEGGLLRACESWDELLRELALALAGEPGERRHHDFVASFVRPNGIDRAATPLLVEAIEEVAAGPAAAEPPPFLAAVVRTALFPAAFATWVAVRWLPSKGWRNLPAVARRAVGRLGKRVRRWLNGKQRRKDKTVRRSVTAANDVELPTTGDIHAALERLAATAGPIVIGPWLSEVGFQVLYWIPFLHWARQRFGLDPARLVVVSHGGPRSWYHELAGRYLDVLDFFTPDEFRTLNQQRIAAAGGQKHRSLSPFDEEILRRVRAALGAQQIEVLHPSLMYNLFVPFWRTRSSFDLVDAHTRFARFPSPPPVPGPPLPADYVAAKFYWSSCFPDTPANRAFLSRTLRALAAHSDVVLLDTGLALDDHRDCEPALAGRIHSIRDRIVPAHNLELQSAVLAGARAFVGTYGGFSYLGPSYGVPSLAVYSQPDGFVPIHLRLAERAYATPPFGAFRVAAAGEVAGVDWLWSEDGVRAVAR